MLRLLEPYYELKKILAQNNFFTSYNLAKLLLEKNLTILGTIRNHRREILHCLYNRMELKSSILLYNHDDGVCLVAYLATHTNSLVTADKLKKLPLTLDYNQRKGGIDMFDKKLEGFSCRRKTGGNCYSFTRCLMLQLTIHTL